MKKIFLPVLLSLTICSSAQKVSNQLLFKKEQKLEITTNMTIDTKSMLGESSGSVVNIEEYRVTASSDETTTLQKIPQKMQLKFSLMGQNYKIDSDNKEDMDGQFGDIIKQVMQQKHEFIIDASGKIIHVNSEKKKSEDENGMLGMMIPGMNAATAIPKEGQPSIFKVLPDGKEVSKNDTWTDSLVTPDQHITTKFTVKEIAGTEVLLDFVQDERLKTKQAAMGMSLDMNSVSKTTGTITLDNTTGIIKQRTAVTTTDANMNMGGNEVNSTTTTTSTTTIKTL